MWASFLCGKDSSSPSINIDFSGTNMESKERKKNWQALLSLKENSSYFFLLWLGLFLILA